MSDLYTQRKKKPKGHKLKTSIPKPKPKKRKSRPTPEYQENEKEVQALLENTSLSIELSSSSRELDNLSRSLDFFCRTSESELIHSTERTRKLELKRERKPIVASNIDKIAGDEAVNSSSDDDIGSSLATEATQSPSSIQQQQNTASTYIQIDEDVLVPRVAGERFQIDDNLLYKPSSILPTTTLLIDDEFKILLTGNIARMINRYCEEVKSRNAQLSKHVIEMLKQSAINASLYSKDHTLYRTFCEHKFHAIFCEPTRNALEIPTRRFFRIFFKELRFTQHPHLLEEHQLSNLLEDIYESYSQRVQTKLCEKLRAELQTERKIVNELLKREASEVEESPDSPATQERRARNLEQHLLCVRALRNKLYEEEAESKRLLTEMLDVWIKLKQLRSTQQFQCTRFKLRIQVQQQTNVAAETHRWSERFETDLNEIYREQLELYYRAKRLWKARARNADDSAVKPKKPNISKLSEELKRKLADCLLAPGEPQIDIQLQRVSDEEFYNMPGQRRLKSFFLKIYFDEEFVSATRSYRIEPDLRLPMNEVFGVLLERRLPKHIRIALYEKSKLASPRKIADISVPLPYPIDNETNQTQHVQFVAQRPAMIKGRLTMRFQCDEEAEPNDMLHMPASPAKAPCTSRPQNEWRAMQPTAQADVASNNAAQSKDAMLSKAVDSTNAPTCTFEEELLQFCHIEQLEKNARFKLLRSRYFKNEPRTRDLRFIPALENELEFDWEATEEPVLEAGNWMDPIDLHKHEGKKYLKSLYEAIRTQCVRLSTAAESAENLLLGDEPASWSTFFQTLALIFQPRRALNVTTSNAAPKSSLSMSLESSQNFKVVLNVVRATGIPVRTASGGADSESRQRSSDSSNMFITTQIYKYSNVRPFIVLSYRDKMCRSLTAEGSNPTWNEQLMLQLSGSLSELRDDIKIMLFDELIENHVNDDLTVRNMDVYQRIQTNWLGEYRLPISVLLAEQKLEGVFELNTPKVLLGYKPPTLDTIAAQTDVNIPVEQYPEIKETVHLWFYLSIEPSFELPHINTACLECSELKEVRQHLQEWSLQALELKPQRFIEPLICTVDGKRVCLTRLLEPVPLPLEASENILESACRFVSLLSMLKSYDACMQFQGVWLNNQTLLDTTWGSPKDFGVLLCNFMLAIGIPCWLILGVARPYGECAFVLYRSEEAELLLIDPCSGKRYAVRDVFCPLSKINFVVATDNLYCNIQSERRVTMTNFNFRDTSCWLPAFSKRNPAPLGGVQNLNYNYNVSGNTFELRRNIERKIMKKISTWRTMRKTIWNRAFQSRLLSILQDLEHLCTFTNGAYTEAKYTDQIAAEFPTYKIYGFTLNFPYTNLTSISERIKSTGIHLNSDKNVEFSLAVHIHVYPNDVLSVWIFLISLIPMRIN